MGRVFQAEGMAYVRRPGEQNHREKLRAYGSLGGRAGEGGRSGRFVPLGCCENNSTMNMGVQISLQDPAFSSSEHRPRSGILRSYGESAFIFFEEPPCCFHSSYTILHPQLPADRHKVPISPHSHQHLFPFSFSFFFFLLVAILVGMKMVSPFRFAFP